MNTPQTGALSSRKPLRLWPGIAAAVVLLLVRLGLPLIFPDAAIFGILGAVVAGLVIVGWWLFFSRAPWSERLGALLLMIVAAVVTRFIVHDSIKGGMMGMMVPIYLAIPGLPLALVVWAAVNRRFTPGPRWVALVAAFILACGAFALVRTDGVTGEGIAQLTWRWTPTAEERLLAEARNTPPLLAPAAAVPGTPTESVRGRTAGEPVGPARPGGSAVDPAPPAAERIERATGTSEGPTVASVMSEREVPRVEWPGFRGPGRDSNIRGVRIETNWSASPPLQAWRRAIGPGWSSFAVGGNRIYTQEQRGEYEVVAGYSAGTGEPLWTHRDAVRFYESNGGAGPRATPTLSNGRIYTLGATGILNALDASTGAVVWSRNAVTDTGVTIPGWGISGSPLIVDDLVVVAASGALIAYDRAAGTQRWFVKSSGGSYSSPHLVTIGGTPQILLMSGEGATSVAPADGTVLWTHPWSGAPIVQPALTPDGDLLITTGDAMGGMGLRRITVARDSSGWTVRERWTSRGLKPYFNDFVVHEGHAYGFDGSILAAIDLTDGQRKWKGGRYGHGQLVLLADQDLLLVLAEEGDLALVSATADKFTELARVPAIEGKTWNHPVLVGELLLVRNGQEMAAFRLARE